MIEFVRRLELDENNNDFIVLIVDDDKQSQEIARSVVEKLGMKNILTATGAMEALMAIRNQKIGLVLLDNGLGPGMSGYDILNKVTSWVEKGIIEKNKIPVFVGISATSNFNELIPCINKGKDYANGLEAQLKELMAG